MRLHSCNPGKHTFHAKVKASVSVGGNLEHGTFMTVHANKPLFEEAKSLLGLSHTVLIPARHPAAAGL